MTPPRRPRPPASRLAALPLAVCLALAACVAPAPEPTPAPSPMPTPTPTPVATPTPVPSFANWMDAPQTAGDWTYQAGLARFGETAAEPRLTLRCDRASGVVEIVRAGTAAAALPMIVRAEAMERSVDARPARSDPPSIVAQVPARDPLLDAMAFSKGRFAIEVAGLETLYVPAYPEVTRVIEDCR
ncbi:MAG TPA: hypothetical protein VEB68_00015 [Croceibacterium sp.]|nr:hypothetical protein [Croceibacterium sp.]